MMPVNTDRFEETTRKSRVARSNDPAAVVNGHIPENADKIFVQEHPGLGLGDIDGEFGCLIDKEGRVRDYHRTVSTN